MLAYEQICQSILFVPHVLCFVVLMNCLLNVFAISVGDTVCLSLNVMVLFLNVWVFCLEDHVWCSRECVCCVCDPNAFLGILSICLIWDHSCLLLSLLYCSCVCVSVWHSGRCICV